MTDKYPDLVALVPKIRGEGVQSFILEGEVVAVDRETGALLPFQTLSNRARKDVAITSVTVDVCLFSFDLMYLNGEGLMDRPFRERRSLLRSLFIELPHHFTWVKSIDATSADIEVISDFYKQALNDKCEGFMAKVLDNLPNPDLLDALNEDGTPKPPPTPSRPTFLSTSRIRELYRSEKRRTKESTPRNLRTRQATGLMVESEERLRFFCLRYHRPHTHRSLARYRQKM
jgi:DNA ligase-1